MLNSFSVKLKSSKLLHITLIRAWLSSVNNFLEGEKRRVRSRQRLAQWKNRLYIIHAFCLFLRRSMNWFSDAAVFWKRVLYAKQVRGWPAGLAGWLKQKWLNIWVTQWEGNSWIQLAPCLAWVVSFEVILI